jgi:hypothetical protein
MAAPTRADRQTTIRLSSNTYDLLADDAELNGRSVGEEMRRRLEASFASSRSPDVDAKTRQLLDVIAVMAQDLEESFPAWHADAGSYQAFARALVRWLRRYEQPPGDASLKPKPGTELLFSRRGPTLENVVMMLIGAANSYVAASDEAEHREDC